MAQAGKMAFMNEIALVLMKSLGLEWGQDFTCNICRETKEKIFPLGHLLIAAQW